jgi:hypothetical protein
LYTSFAFGSLKVDLVTDNLAIDNAQGVMKQVSKYCEFVLQNFPEGYQPEQLTVYHTDNYCNQSNGYGCRGLIMFQGFPFFDPKNGNRAFHHELVHALSPETKNTCSWLSEGLAMYLGNSHGDINNLELPYYAKQQLLQRIDEIGNFSTEDDTFKYYGGQLLVCFIDELYGREFLFDFYKITGDVRIEPMEIGSNRKQFEQAVDITFGIPFDDFVENFKDYIREKLTK